MEDRRLFTIQSYSLERERNDSLPPVHRSVVDKEDKSTMKNEFSNRITTDIKNSDSLISIYCELPGVHKNDIYITFNNNKVSIQAKKIRTYSLPEMSEIKYGTFERTMILPICVTKRENVTVTFEDGVLRIVIDKVKEGLNKFTFTFQDEEDSQ
jgi:HSP20 family molecular chaperone IbpA